MSSNQYIKGTIKPIVLKLLSENKRMYGYEITQEVKRLSGGEIEITYGALYPILYKLENETLLKTEQEIVDNRVRKYYSLTEKGKEEARVKVAELEQFLDVIRTVLAPSPKPGLLAWGI
ncbi:PadR family transcriptional regulator [Fulvivirga sedimenti]|uniref:PadR family transcriptional regulator n=1 Tax=Fulvivirga sedimenti TaxID=2879465 RepID=A0A9X1HXM1_9BACT|nr:PadR family transcriptional regulator [Fulvivirga sedimenti]MCA6078329.1 PadR family transcriptional regulator [Fulvivirga sedimenti]